MAHRNRWFTYWTWWFSMAMLNNQMVYFQTLTKFFVGPWRVFGSQTEGSSCLWKVSTLYTWDFKKGINLIIVYVIHGIFHGYWWLFFIPWFLCGIQWISCWFEVSSEVLHPFFHTWSILGVRTPWRWWNMSWWKAKARTARLAHGLGSNFSNPDG